jgi:hypothetical protein
VSFFNSLNHLDPHHIFPSMIVLSKKANNFLLDGYTYPGQFCVRDKVGFLLQRDSSSVSNSLVTDVYPVYADVCHCMAQCAKSLCDVPRTIRYALNEQNLHARVFFSSQYITTSSAKSFTEIQYKPIRVNSVL